MWCQVLRRCHRHRNLIWVLDSEDLHCWGQYPSQEHDLKKVDLGIDNELSYRGGLSLRHRHSFVSSRMRKWWCRRYVGPYLQGLPLGIYKRWAMSNTGDLKGDKFGIKRIWNGTRKPGHPSDKFGVEGRSTKCTISPRCETWATTGTRTNSWGRQAAQLDVISSFIPTIQFYCLPLLGLVCFATPHISTCHFLCASPDKDFAANGETWG